MRATILFPPMLLFFFLFSSYFVSYSSSQFTPQNIEVFYPFRLPPPPPPPLPPPPPPPPLPPPPPTPFTIPTPTPSKSKNKTVVTAVAVTAASTLVLSGLFFLLLVKYRRYRKDNEKPVLGNGNDDGNSRDPVLIMGSQFTRIEGVKGVIVDEEGLDVLYWKNIDDDSGNKRAIFKQESHKNNEKKDEHKVGVHIQEVPLLRGKSSGSHVWPRGDENYENEMDIKSQKDSYSVVNQDILMESQLSLRSPPPTPPPTPPPPPPPPRRPPVVVERKSHVPLPPPLLVPKQGNLTSSSVPVPAASQVKLKPLDWDKVNANVGHPTAWDKLDKGSFR